MRLIIVSITFFAFSVFSYGQQPDIEHVIPKPLELSPAYAGSYNQYRIDLMRRSQWVTYDGSPEEFNVSIDIPILILKSGIGLFFNSSKNGPVKTNDLNLAYSYNLKIKEFNFQLGVGINHKRHKLNFSSLIIAEDNDPLLSNEENKADRLALMYGVFIYTDQFYFSLSYNDILLFTNEDELNYNKKNLDLYAGYHLFKGEVVSICPTLILRNIIGDVKSWGGNITATINNIFWAGMTYDDLQQLTIGLGINIWKCHGGLRYSNNFNDIGGFTNWEYGAFELTTGFYFDKK